MMTQKKKKILFKSLYDNIRSHQNVKDFNFKLLYKYRINK